VLEKEKILSNLARIPCVDTSQIKVQAAKSDIFHLSRHITAANMFLYEPHKKKF